jgi:hypothetical protein
MCAHEVLAEDDDDLSYKVICLNGSRPEIVHLIPNNLKNRVVSAFRAGRFASVEILRS